MQEGLLSQAAPGRSGSEWRTVDCTNTISTTARMHLQLSKPGNTLQRHAYAILPNYIYVHAGPLALHEVPQRQE